MSNKTWLITGCSSGLGRAFAEAVLAHGYNAVATARRPECIQTLVQIYPQTCLGLVLDVTDKTRIAHVVKQAETRFGGVDVLVNNAGYALRAAVEEGEEQEIKMQFDTVFFGSVNMIQAVLPGMRRRRSGTIINISSISGRLALAGSGYYSGAKFALEGMSDALRKELAPLGIRVMVVEPGAFRTNFAGDSLKGTKNVIDDYQSTVGPRRKGNDKSDGTQIGDPRKAAKVVIKLEEGKKLPFRLLLGNDAVKVAREELESQLKELEEWEKVSVTTGFQS